MMEYKVYYNGQETSDFDTLARWFQELKDKNRSLGREYSIAQDHITENEDCIHSMSKDISELQRRNRSLESDIDILKEKNKILMAEREKTNEVLKRYCGDSVDAPISTMVGLIIDDYFYQKAETENQVRALQKAEKTIEGLNKELVEYADKVEELEERKNKRSPRWPSDVMRIGTLENKVDELTRENERLRYSQPWMYERSRYSQPWMYGMSSKEATNRIFGINGTIHKLMEENKKLKDALEFCQKEASSARAHAHNVEVNAERIRLGID